LRTNCSPTDAVDAVEETSESDSLTRVESHEFDAAEEATALAFCILVAVVVVVTDAVAVAEDVAKTPSTPKSSDPYVPYP